MIIILSIIIVSSSSSSIIIICRCVVCCVLFVSYVLNTCVYGVRATIGSELLVHAQPCDNRSTDSFGFLISSGGVPGSIGNFQEIKTQRFSFCRLLILSTYSTLKPDSLWRSVARRASLRSDGSEESAAVGFWRKLTNNNKIIVIKQIDSIIISILLQVLRIV